MPAKFRARDRQRIRRLMAALPDTVNEEIVAVYQQHGPAILAKARSETPVRTGKLRSLLAFKIMPATKTRSPRFRIGLLTKAVQDKVFYAKWLEYGRGPIGKKGKYRGRYIGRISPDKYDFVRGRTGTFMQQTLGRDLRAVLKRALAKAARGE